MVNSISKIGVSTSTALNNQVNNNITQKISFQASEPHNDSFDSTKQKQVLLPNISMWRLAFNYLNDKQIEEVNRLGYLPANAKFVPNGVGGYEISNNFFGIRTGTQKLPEGFELKRNVLGFTLVLPKETNGLLIR